MNNTKYKFGIVLLVCALAAIAVLSFTETHIRNEVATVLGAVQKAAPEQLADMMHSYKNDKTLTADGHQVLEQYGYGQSLYRFIPGQYQALLFLLLFAVLLLVFLFLGLDRRQKTQAAKKRVQELTAYLNRMMTGQYDTMPQASEDLFSPLEDSIYKGVVLLREEREQAQRARQNLADNLANLSHQLKTPVASMQLTSALIKKHVQDQQAVADTCQMEDQLEHFQRLVAALLTLSKLDAGMLPLEHTEFDLEEMLIDAVQPFVGQIEAHEIHFSIHGAEGITVIGDFSWYSEAVGNIIKNCMEHTPHRGKISITCQDNPIYTEIVIQDNGDGIAEADLPHLFERFYRGANSPKDSAGIGLALAKSIVEKENGVIIAENAETGGARFRIKLYHCH